MHCVVGGEVERGSGRDIEVGGARAAPGQSEYSRQHLNVGVVIEDDIDALVKLIVPD